MGSKTITRQCELCQSPFSFWLSRRPNARFCSMSCAKTRKDPVKTFLARVNSNPGQGPKGDCWLWTGGISDGRYGAFYWKGKQTGAHRVAFEIANKTINDELLVLHKCDNPPCVRPKHLFQGTPQDNMTDKVNKGRMPRGMTHYTIIGKKQVHKVQC